MRKLKNQLKRFKREIADKETEIGGIDAKIRTLKYKVSAIEMRLGNLEKARQKRCKHDGGMKKNFNARDDASFKYWLFCKKCDLHVGHENFNGSIEYNMCKIE